MIGDVILHLAPVKSFVYLCQNTTQLIYVSFWFNATFFSALSQPTPTKSSFFVHKFNFDFPIKLSIFRGWKTRENVVVLGFLAVDNFDFTRKIVKKNLGEKLVKMLGFGQNWIFGQKFDFSNSVQN